MALTIKDIPAISDVVWVVAKLWDNREMYVYDVREDGVVVWTNEREWAVNFYTQVAIEMFVHDRLKSRAGIYTKYRNTPST